MTLTYVIEAGRLSAHLEIFSVSLVPEQKA